LRWVYFHHDRKRLSFNSEYHYADTGAKAVGVGRPFLYAMSAYGQPGVERAMQILKDEIEMGMR
jgi:hypothetical protein